MLLARAPRVAGRLALALVAVVVGGAGLVLSLVALFAVGAGVSLLTGRGLLFSGARQVVIGAVAAGVTFLVGSAVGVAVT